jgi:hypothetical protein
VLGRLAHASRFEPVVVDAAQGVLAFDVPFGRVEEVLGRLAKSGIGEFLAHLSRTNESA